MWGFKKQGANVRRVFVGGVLPWRLYGAEMRPVTDSEIKVLTGHVVATSGLNAMGVPSDLVLLSQPEMHGRHSS